MKFLFVCMLASSQLFSLAYGANPGFVDCKKVIETFDHNNDDSTPESPLPVAIVLPLTYCKDLIDKNDEDKIRSLENLDFLNTELWVAIDGFHSKSQLNLPDVTGKLQDGVGTALTGGFQLQAVDSKFSARLNIQMSLGAVGANYSNHPFDRTSFFTIQKGKRTHAAVFQFQTSGAEMLRGFYNQRIAVGGNFMGFNIDVNQKTLGLDANMHWFGPRARLIVVNRNRLQLAVAGGLDVSSINSILPKENAFKAQFDSKYTNKGTEDAFFSSITALGQIYLAAEGLALRHVAKFYYRQALTVSGDRIGKGKKSENFNVPDKKTVTRFRSKGPGNYWEGGMEWKILPGNLLLNRTNGQKKGIPFISFFGEAGQRLVKPQLFAEDGLPTPVGSKNIFFGVRLGAHWGGMR